MTGGAATGGGWGVTAAALVYCAHGEIGIADGVGAGCRGASDWNGSPGAGTNGKAAAGGTTTCACSPGGASGGSVVGALRTSTRRNGVIGSRAGMSLPGLSAEISGGAGHWMNLLPPDM